VLVDPRAPSNHLWRAVDALEVLGLATGPPVVSALRAVVADATADVDVRHSASTVLAGLAPEHAAEILADPAGSPGWRKAVLDLTAGGEEAVPELRTLLTDPDTTCAVRRTTVRLLHELCPIERYGVLEVLHRQAADEHSDPYERYADLRLLAEFDPGTADRVVAHHFDVLADDQEAVDTRRTVASSLVALDRTFAQPGLAVLRSLAGDPRATRAERAHATQWLVLWSSPRTDEVLGLAHAVARDVLTAPEISPRERVAAAAARLLHAIAVDAAIRPALRWRAAEDLTRLGRAGRAMAETVLVDLAKDDSLPVTARTGAARVLVTEFPGRRRAAVKILRDLSATQNPLHRRELLLALGVLDPVGAGIELSAMSRDEHLGAVVRMWCAEAVVELNRDDREAAAAVVRAIAHDESVPRHVRRRAARDLAEWSLLCRTEARAVIVALAR
jgi:uncharacterized protein (UPF0147 family)